MIVPYIWILLAVTWFLLWLAFEYNDYLLIMLGGIFLFILGITIISDGIGDTSNITTQAFGIIHLGIAFYIVIRKNLEIINAF